MKPTYTITIENEDTDVRGNCMASGDDAFDKECEDAIIERLERGDLEAWCCVKVTAKVGDFEGVAYLGCCTLDDKYGPEDCAHDHGLKEEALEDLKRELRNASQRGNQAAKILKRLE